MQYKNTKHWDMQNQEDHLWGFSQLLLTALHQYKAFVLIVTGLWTLTNHILIIISGSSFTI